MALVTVDGICLSLNQKGSNYSGEYILTLESEGDSSSSGDVLIFESEGHQL